MENRISVIHSLRAWLPITSNWIYKTLKGTPNSVEHIVVAENSVNLEYFPIEKRYSGISLFHQKRLAFRRRLGFFPHDPLVIKAVKKHNPKIIHSHFGHFGFYNHKITKKLGLKHVVTFYGYDVNQLPKEPRWRRRYEELFRDVDLVLCEGPAMRESIIQLGCTPQKIKVQRIGVDLTEIPFCPRKWNPSDEALKILIASTFREKKGIPCALEALGRLLPEFSNFEVTMVGDAAGFGDVPEKNKILKKIIDSGLEDKVKMLGFVKPHELISLARNSHIYMSTSKTASNGDSEGGAPVAIIEMAASGMPVVTTKHCDIPNVFPSSYQSMLSPEEDVNQVFLTLRRLIDYPDWSSFQLENRKFIESELSIGKTARSLYDHYETLLKQ